MHAVITGDIIQSRRHGADAAWLPALKKELSRCAAQARDWHVFRGDSFQLQLPEAHTALLIALSIKARIKQFKGLDVRQTIGLDASKLPARKVSEAASDAHVRSGQAFDVLGKRTLTIHSPWPEFDAQMNLYLALAALCMDHWSPSSAETVHQSIVHPRWTQRQLAEHLNIGQGRVSQRLKRAGHQEIKAMEQRYRELLKLRRGA